MNYKQIIFVLTTFLCTTPLISQCVINSTNGYAVSVAIAPVNMIKHTNGGGCTYETVMQFNVQFTGTNIPANLFTLQGTVTCFGATQFFNLPNAGGSGTAVSATTSGPFIAGNCAGYTPIGCTNVVIQIHGPGIPSQFVPCSFATFPNPLPIELIAFSGEKNNSSVDLNWSTASERNNEYFTLEHSVDGINFEVIERVIGAGTTNELQEYNYTNAPFSEGLNYYRLSQTDFDGTTKRLEIIAIENKNSQSYSVYPNPTVERNVNLQINSTSKTSINYRIYSMYGELLKSETIYSKDQIKQIELPQVGSQFILELEQDHQIIGREKVIVL